jgi:hypothetical protein
LSSTSPRVERGAALLDMEAPGWTSKIDLDTLNIAHTDFCVLGQVYGDYDAGLDTLGGEAERAPVKYGFLQQGNEGAARLTDKWRAAIRKRLRQEQAA